MRPALVLLVALAGSASALAAPGRTPLAGTYTIDPALSSSHTNFRSFAEATAALASGGVSAAVVFEVAAAVFTERVFVVGPIAGVSAVNTVTFLGSVSGGVRSTVTYTPTSNATNAVFEVGRAAWVILDGLRFETANPDQPYGTVLRVEGDDVVVRNCEIESIDDAAVGAAEAVGIYARGLRIALEDNRVDGGEVGVYLGSRSGLASGSHIWGTDVNTPYGAGLVVEDQGVASGTGVSIRDNDVAVGPQEATDWVGIHVRDVTGGAVLARNRVTVRGGAGVRLERLTNTSTTWTSVVNTMVSALGVFSVEPPTGIEVLDADRVRVQNNSVRLDDDDGAALLIDALSQTVDVQNNLLVHEGTGPLLDVAAPGAILTLDTQVYQAAEQPTRFLVRWGGVAYTTLAAFQSASGREAGAVVWPVTFLTSVDLHLAGASDGDGTLIGTPIGSVPSDFDGDARSATAPYRGADEAPTPLTPPPPPMAGAYAIDAGQPTAGIVFGSFSDALAALAARGVGGPVEFRVASGTYTEQLFLPGIRGSSAANTVTFAGYPADPHPVLRFLSGSPLVDYTVLLREAEYVAFSHLDLRALGATAPTVVRVEGGRALTFSDCLFRPGSPTAGAGLNANGNLTVGAPNPRELRVLGSTFIGGNRGVEIRAILSGADNRPEGNHEIRGNTFTDQRAAGTAAAYGIHLSNQAAEVLDNTVTSTASPSGFRGIYIHGSVDVPASDLVVEGNRVVGAQGTGIYWERYRPGPGVALRLANNTVRMSGTGATTGITIEQPDGLLAAHNTASVAGADPATTAGRLVASLSSTSVTLLNNVFTATAGRALDLDVAAPSAGYVYDYTVVSTTGGPLAHYRVGAVFDGDCATVACMQAASGTAHQDAHTVQTPVTFANAAAGDLHLAGGSVGDPALAGLWLSEVPLDLDGDARSAIHPYRGADEAATPLGTIRVSLQLVLQGAYPASPTVDGLPDAMATGLRDGGLLPTGNPYALPLYDGTGIEYDGTEAVDAAFFAAHAVVDWIVVGIRPTPSAEDVARRAVFLRSDGRVIDTDGTVGVTFPGQSPGGYHVAVYHRNHLAVLSAAAVALDEAGPFVRLYRSTDVYGGTAGLVLLEDAGFDVWGLVAGDGDADGRVLEPDRQAVWEPTVGQAGYLPGDYTLDGSVLADDRQALWEPNVGAQSAVPGQSLAPTDPPAAERRRER